MSTSIGALELEMYANLARLKQDMDAAKSLVGDAVSTMKSLLGGLAVGAAAVSFARMVKESIDATEALKDLATQSGHTVESLSAMRDIGAGTKTSVEAIAGASNKMSKNLAVASEESKGAANAIKALGLDFDTFQKLKPDDRILELAKALNKFEDGGGKSAVAMTLMGKEGAKLLPFMKDLANAGQLHASVTAEQAEMADRFNDMLAQSAVRTEAMKRALALGLLPALIDLYDLLNLVKGMLVDYLTPAASATTGKFDAMAPAIGAVGTVLETLVVLGANVAFVLNGVGTEIGGLTAQATALARGDFSGAVEIGRQMRADAESARAALDKFEQQVLGATDRVLQQREALRNHSLATSEVNRELNSLGARYGSTGKKVLEFSDQVTKLGKGGKDAYASLIASSKAHVAEMQQQELGVDKLTAGEKGLLEMQAKIEAGTLAYSQAGYKAAAAQFQLDAAEERRIKKAAEYLALLGKVAEVTRKAEADEITRTEALRGQVVQLIEQNERMRVGDAAFEARARAQDLATATDLEWQAAMQGGNFQLEEQARLLRQRAGLLGDGALLKEAKAMADEWRKFTDQVENGLTDSLYRAFESGSGFFSTFWKGITNTLKTTALRLGVDVVAIGAKNALGSALGGSVGGGAGGVLGGINTAASSYTVGTGAYNVAAGLLGYGGSSAGAAAGTLGYANAVGAVGGDSLGALIAANSGWGGVAVGGSAAGGTAAAGAAATAGVAAEGAAGAAGAAAGAEGALAAMGPYGWIALAVIAVLALTAKGGTPHSGSVVTADALGARTGGDDPTGILANYQKETDDALKALAGGAVGSLNALAGAFGGARDFSALTKFAADGEDSSFGAFSLSRAGTKVSEIAPTGTNDAKAYSSDAREAFESFALDVGSTVREALDAIELPQWAREQIDALGDGANLDKLNALAAAIAQTQQAFDAFQTSVEPLGFSFTTLAGLSSDAMMALTEAAGGLDKLGAGVQAYYANFFDSTEHAAVETARLTEVLAAAGLTLPETRAEFRATVEGIVSAHGLETESGRLAYTSLMSVAGAFAALVPEVEKVEKVTRTAADIERERYGLETELLRLQGNTEEIRNRELAALANDDNRDLQRLIWDIQDLNAAAGDAAQSVDKLASSAGRVTGPGGKSASTTDFAGALMGVGRSDLEEAVKTMGSSWQFYLDNNIGPSLGALANSIALGRAAASGANAPPPTFLGTGSGSAGDMGGHVADQLRATQDLTSEMSRLRKSLGDYLDTLKLSDLSTLDPQQKYAEARAAFAAVAAQAGAGDQAAAEQLQARSQPFLQLSEKFNARNTAYAGDYSMVVAAIEKAVALLGKIDGTTKAGVMVNANGMSALESAIADGTDATRSVTYRARVAEQQYVE